MSYNRSIYSLIKSVVFTAAMISISSSPVIAQQAYITNQLDSTLSVISLETLTKLQDIPVSEKPAGITVCDNGDVLLSSTDAGEINLLQTNEANHKLELVKTWAVGKGPFGLSCGGEHSVYISDWFANKVYLFDYLDGDIDQTIAVGTAPAQLLNAESTARLYVANRDDNTVSVIDTNSHQVIETIEVGEAPYGLAFADKRMQLYVVNVRSSDVTVIDTSTNKVTETWATGEWPYCAAVSKDMSRLFVTNQEDGTVSVIDTDTGETASLLDVSATPEGINVSPDGKSLIVVSWEEGVIDVFDLETYQLMQSIETGEGSRSVGDFISQ